MTPAPVAAPETLPKPVRLLGPFGLVPFLGLLLLAAALPDWRGELLRGLAAYGAVILSFLGAVHWGFALRAPPQEAGAAWPRIALGVLPSLVAWVALLLPLAPGLALLTLGIAATAVAEERATRAGLMPTPYLRLRQRLSLAAGLCLALAALLA